MNHTILGLVVTVAMMGATSARADDCGPQPTYAPQGQNWNTGSYQLQTQQVWIPGTTQQIWEPGGCRSIPGPFGGSVMSCTVGHYRTVATAGHYENRQNWVWVAYSYDQYNGNQYGYGYDGYGRGNRGNGWNHHRHGRHGAVPVGY